MFSWFRKNKNNYYANILHEKKNASPPPSEKKRRERTKIAKQRNKNGYKNNLLYSIWKDRVGTSLWHDIWLFNVFYKCDLLFHDFFNCLLFLCYFWRSFWIHNLCGIDLFRLLGIICIINNTMSRLFGV